MRILVISNCQAQPLASMLSLFCSDAVVHEVRVHVMNPESISSFVKAKSALYDIVLSIRLGSNFGLFEQDNLKESFDKSIVYFITNMHFAGLHPDLTYLGGLGSRCTGVLGDYHSKLALWAFMNGLDVQQADKLFVGVNYERMGFYSEFAKSIDRLRAADAKSDISVLGEFIEKIHSEPMMFSVNHPTSAFFFFYAMRIASHLQDHGHVKIIRPRWNPLYYPNILADSVIFPIYPEIAEFHQIRYDSSYIYKSHSHGSVLGKLYDRLSFLRAEYETFNQYGHEKIQQSVQWPAIKELLAR